MGEGGRGDGGQGPGRGARARAGGEGMAGGQQSRRSGSRGKPSARLTGDSGTQLRAGALRTTALQCLQGRDRSSGPRPSIRHGDSNGRGAASWERNRGRPGDDGWRVTGATIGSWDGDRLRLQPDWPSGSDDGRGCDGLARRHIRAGYGRRPTSLGGVLLGGRDGPGDPGGFRLPPGVPW
jgi:hypothetical protein